MGSVSRDGRPHRKSQCDEWLPHSRGTWRTVFPRLHHDMESHKVGSLIGVDILYGPNGPDIVERTRMRLPCLNIRSVRYSYHNIHSLTCVQMGGNYNYMVHKFTLGILLYMLTAMSVSHMCCLIKSSGGRPRVR